tara:strand:- start:818 stop:1237 length:420 start_codon:yes stop_codon:yes gene_type:complete
MSVVILVLMGCSNPVGLDTESHWNQVTYSFPNLTARVDWRFISQTKIENGIQVQGAYRVTFVRIGLPSEDSRITIEMRALRFEDEEKFMVARDRFVFSPEFSMRPVSSHTEIGKFEFEVASIKVANSISGAIVEIGVIE